MLEQPPALSSDNLVDLAMVDLNYWLREEEPTVRDFALGLEMQLTTVQDRAYRSVAPSAENRDRLADYIFSRCRAMG